MLIPSIHSSIHPTQALIEKYARFAIIDFAITKISNKLNKLEPWIEARTTYFQSMDVGNSVSSAEQRLSSYEAFLAQVCA